MRIKEWYGWHFPELAKIVTDNEVYTKLVALFGVTKIILIKTFKKSLIFVFFVTGKIQRNSR